VNCDTHVRSFSLSRAQPPVVLLLVPRLSTGSERRQRESGDETALTSLSKYLPTSIVGRYNGSKAETEMMDF